MFVLFFGSFYHLNTGKVLEIYSFLHAHSENDNKTYV